MPQSRFRGKNFGTNKQTIELLYGNTLLPKYDPGSNQWSLVSYRVMGPAMVMGHAAGVAAVLAARHDRTFRQLKVSDVQNELLQQGAFLG